MSRQKRGTPESIPPTHMAFNLTTSEVATLLRTSERTLQNLRREGCFRPGVHYRAVGVGTKRPPLLWDLEAAEAAMTARSRKVLSR